jgi:hypothetical protein
VTHETREAVTDPTGTAWYDINGAEADDKCAWSPPPFFGTGGYGYQYEWSNKAGACIPSPPIVGGLGTPTLTVVSDRCFGDNEASWTAVAGATYYELWGASNSTFTSPYTIYSGALTSTSFSVAGLTYVHVHACNASGCGAFSNTATANYLKLCRN